MEFSFLCDEYGEKDASLSVVGLLCGAGGRCRDRCGTEDVRLRKRVFSGRESGMWRQRAGCRNL